ncbi:MAG: DUF2207 family protein [Longibaculum sp.]
MKKKICIIFSLFLSIFFSLTPVQAKETVLSQMLVYAYINEDGSAHIKEIWDMSVYEGTEVYKVFNNMGPSKITNLKVKDETGLEYENIGKWNSNVQKEKKNGKCGLIQKSGGYELCFGIGEYGKKKYTFEYDISYFIKQYNDAQGINYAFFSDMSLKPKYARITVSSPYKFDGNNAKIWAFGYDGDVQFQAGKVVMKTKGGSSSRIQKMQLLMRIDDGTFENGFSVPMDFQAVLDDAKTGSNYDKESGFNPVAIFVILNIGFIVVVSVLLGTFLAKRTKQEPSVFNDHIPFDKKNLNMFRDIPCHKDIFEFYYLAKKANLISDTDRGGMIAALILRWVQEGYIHFDKREESHMVFFKKDGFSIDLSHDIPCHNRLDTKMLEYFRQAAGDNGCLETKEFDKWCKNHYTSIDSWFDDIDSFIEGEYRRKGLLSIESFNTSFMGLKMVKDRDVFDASIREEMEHVAGLKMFLQEMSLINEKEVIEVKMWEEYLIFASILGIADKVQDQLGEMCPTFNQQSNLDTIYTMHMVHMFAYNSMQASRAAAMAAQSSRSSGYGGGSSFGGGGGGFSGGGGGGVR